MIRLVSYRVLQAGLVAVMVGALTFIMVRSLPGDMAFRIAAGRYGYDLVDGAAAEQVRRELGLDRPAIAAFADWLWSMARFDLGVSLVSGVPVVVEIRHQLGHSVELAVVAILLSMVLGPPIGVLAAIRPGGLFDRLVFVATVGLRSLPQFVIGLLLIYGLSVHAGLLPAAGHGGARFTVLPALTLALGLAAVSSRIARDATITVMASPYYRFGLTKGLPPGETFRRHGVRNIAVPVITYLGVQLVYLIEGVVVVETLFAWPGIGHALVHAIVARDVPMIQGTALVMGLMFVVLNGLVDLVCHLIDPRRRAA
ncbi:peptide/nickel transport system permease protein [Tepidamorphus gemmatus]|uniref:Peptide/nickel transport system permease protein n=1 Tax=Tepidamorphus gemmatus TaxID=747076 RepID=A0A4R3M516_9HYPH|nr:ABC transporter permease [Tepidamorphus gemmatus]TCT06517.1 peptide/nickel transport system permease protein [Tepidamorphus gemmatus]